MQDIQVLKDLNATKRLRTEAALNRLLATRRAIEAEIEAIYADVDRTALKLRQGGEDASTHAAIYTVDDFQRFEHWKQAQQKKIKQLQLRRDQDTAEITAHQEALKTLIVRDENLQDMLKRAQMAHDAETIDKEGELAQSIWATTRA